jgi:peptide/nickel transport system substrate-binding protein
MNIGLLPKEQVNINETRGVFRMFSKRFRLVIATAVIGTTLVTGCNSQTNQPAASTDQASQTTTEKKVINISLPSDPQSLDPSPSTAREDRQVQNSIYDKLFDVDKNGEIIPMLAESFEVSPDQKTYTLKLKQGVKFHDGTDFNADAVKFNLERYLIDTSNRKSELKDISKIDVVDPYTVKIELSKTFSPFISILTDRSGMMVSPEAAKKYGDDYINHPVGTGPYIFVEHVNGDHITLKKNESYWNGVPKIDEVNYRVFPNGNAALQNLKSGQLDFLIDVQPKEIATIKDDPNLTMIAEPSMAFMAIFLNVTKEPFTNKYIRQAVNMAIDREALVKVVFDGYATPANSPFAPGNIANGDSDKPIKPDPEAIKALLAKGGKPDGFTFKLQIGITPVNEQSGTVVQNMLKPYGINVELEKFEKSTLSDNAINGNFVGTLYGWSGRLDPDQNFYRYLVTDQQNNYSRLSNPDLDKLIKDARAELDPAKRKIIYDQAMEIVHDEASLAVLYHDFNLFGYSKKVTGYEYVPDWIVRTAKLDKQ